jgi:hypothetical protein
VHNIEPYYNWRSLYIASEDERSPFYNREYSEFEYTNHIYDFVIHPQWDDIGSETLFIKILFADYEDGYAIIEVIGEWNDCIGNDIMFLKRDIIDILIQEGIQKYIIIGENILNFHADNDIRRVSNFYAECADVRAQWSHGKRHNVHGAPTHATFESFAKNCFHLTWFHPIIGWARIFFFD